MGQLLAEKMTVPAQSPYPRRPRLIGLLESGIGAYNSTVICGRAGTGKTTLVAEVARSSGRKTAWYKVDSSEIDHRFFLRYLLASINNQLKGSGVSRVIRFAEMANLEEMEAVAELLVFQLIEGCNEPLLVVIDDLHLVYDASWIVSFFGRLLPLLPSNIHVVLSGRSLPPAPLWRMRSKQRLNVIDEALLAFTEDETSELFARLRLPAHLADSALALTHGRALHLQSLARDLARVADPSAA